MERFDTVHAGRGIEMLMFAPVLGFGAVLRRFLQMERQPVQFPNHGGRAESLELTEDENSS